MWNFGQNFLILVLINLTFGEVTDMNFSNLQSTVSELVVAFQQQQMKLDSTTEDLRETKIELAETKNDLKMTKLQLEVAKKTSVPKSCSEVINLGVTTSRNFDLDIDGPHFGLPAVTAHCEIPSGITTIGQNFEVNVETCDSPDFFSADVPYPGSLEQIVALIQDSNTCSQSLTIECEDAPLKHAGTVRFKWIDSKGTIHEQDILGEGKCNEVLRSGTSIDTGSITDKQFLPIKQVLYGPMPHANQRMKITVGPLKCTPSAQSYQHETLKFDGEIDVRKNHKLPQVFNQLGKEYFVKFDIKIDKEFSSPEWLNVFRLTSTDSNCCDHGDRIPALFLHKNKQLTFTNSIGSQGNYHFYFPYELDRTYHIVISQTQSRTGKFEYCTKIDGLNIHCLINDQPRIFENVYLYVSDPWHQSLEGHGKLNNLEINSIGNLNDFRSRIWKLEKETEDIFDQLIPCPTENPNYHYILGRCYFFETQVLDFDSAQANCGSKFPRGGHLFEPTSLLLDKIVAKKAIKVTGASRKWIGVHDKEVEGTFKYADKGVSLAFTPVWQASNPSNGGGNGEDCIEFGTSEEKWNDNSCERQYMSVCESK